MNLTEILGISGGGIIIFIFSLIKIPKLEINLWGLLAKFIGKALNRDMYDKVDDLSNKINHVQKTLEEHLSTEEEEKVRDARKRILDFNDEIIRGLYHSKEHFDEILEDITMYNRYCNEHENYENSKATLAIKHVQDVYDQKSNDGF